MKPKRPLKRMAYSEGAIPRKSHWFFRLSNDWEIISFIHGIELLSFSWDKQVKWVAILGFSFIWEKYDTSGEIEGRHE